MEKDTAHGIKLIRDNISILSDSTIPESIRSEIARKILAQEADHLSLELERRKFIWNTPIVAAIASILTLTATFVFDSFKNSFSTSNTMTLEERRSQIQDEATDRDFQYEILRTELQKEGRDNVARANVLLFLARAGILDTLEVQELEKMAQEQQEDPSADIIPQLTSPNQSAIKFSCPPPAYPIDPLETSLDSPGRAVLMGAIAENNAGISESCAPQRIREYLSSIGNDEDPQTANWGAAFTAWLSITQGEQPDLLAQRTVRDQWLAALEANKTFQLGEQEPAPGDIVYVLTRNFAAPVDPIEARKPNGPEWSGMTGVVFSATDTTIEFIAGNVGGAVRLTYVPRSNSRIIGFVRF